MGDCIFCKIVRGELPCYQVFENELFLGFLDIHPRTEGHTLVIPKKHYQWVYDVPEFDQFWLAVLKITERMKTALSPSFITYITHGLEVQHAHIHIFPRTKDTSFVPNEIIVDKKKMEEITRKISSVKIPPNSHY